MGNLSPKDVLVRMWRTPNPYALKFTFNVPMKNTGKATFHSPQECDHLPLVCALFTIKGVKRAYLFQNQITLTHDGTLTETEMEHQMRSVIQTRIAVHNPDFSEPSATTSHSQKKSSSSDPTLLKIEEILDRTIRPGLQADGGDLDVISMKDNDVQIAYQGACGGCPSAMTGTLEAIENILRNELNNPRLTVTPL